MAYVRLPLPSNFSFDAVVRSHGWYDLPPFDYDRDKGILRTGVEVTPLTARHSRRKRERDAASLLFRVRGGRLEAESETLDRGALTRITRRIFSLELSLDGLARSFAEEPKLARALARGSGRMLRAPTLFEDAVKVLLTTNCSWAATKGMVTRLIAQAGAGGRAFPSPEAVAALPLSVLKAKIRCGYRAGSLARLARRVASGRLDLAAWEKSDLAAEQVRAAILEEKGFGPYAAEGLLRILGRHDFLAIDSWIRQKYRRLYPGRAHSTDRAIARRYCAFGAHRGLALWLDMTDDWHEGEEALWP